MLGKTIELADLVSEFSVLEAEEIEKDEAGTVRAQIRTTSRSQQIVRFKKAEPGEVIGFCTRQGGTVP